jgi:hypothetical protein
MPVNFLDIVTDKKEFGICDDVPPPHIPAYLDFNMANQSNWIAVVKNYIKAKITFVPVDNRLELTKPDGTNLQKRCDALLAYEKASGKTVIFVELKQRCGGNWKKDADKQLRETIGYFEKLNEAKQYTTKRAYIANSLRPKFNEDDKIRKKRFYDDTKYSLEIEREIQIN